MVGDVDRELTRREYAVARLLLREARVLAGLRQSDLAARIGEPQSFVSKVESGERRLDLVELHHVCMALSLPLSEFVRRFESRLAGKD